MGSRYQAIEQPALLQVLDEERQLAEWRHRRRRVPLHVNPTGVGVSDRRPCLNLSKGGQWPQLLSSTRCQSAMWLRIAMLTSKATIRS